MFKNMEKKEYKLLNKKEKLLFLIRTLCIIFCLLPQKLGNWATDKLNKSYYGYKN